MEKYNFFKGTSPLIISAPHVGSYIPKDIASRMTDIGQQSVDSDWHVDRLYDFAKEMNVSILSATHSRYVVDLNRPHDDQNLYPGQDTTGLSPVNSFSHENLYKSAEAVPTQKEIEMRVETYWRPYHDKLRETLEENLTKHGYALLWDAHSIKSEVPRFFEGRLPDMNLGTANGSSCASELEQRLLEVAKAHKEFSHVLNGRFKGGHITRHYGDPSRNIHAVQLEQSQITYMNESAPFNLIPEKVTECQPLLKNFIQTMLDFKPT